MKPQITGLEYWRSLEQLADDPQVRALVEAEFPGYSPDDIRAMSRRRFMKLMAASMALAGLTLSGCRRAPKEKLAPHASSDGQVPGSPEQYATIMELGGIAMPLLATSFDGRPIKIEGNPSHPFSRVTDRYGAADIYAQASVLELYDPDRSRGLVDRARGPNAATPTWDDFAHFANLHFGPLRAREGEGLAVLSEASDGPSVADMRQRLFKAFPKAKWHEYEPISQENELTGARLAFGRALRPQLHLDRAAVTVLFDADVLGVHPAHVRYAADWAAGRRSADHGSMSRVYLAESGFSTTGAAADVRIPARPLRVEEMLRALAAALGVKGVARPALDADETAFVEAAVADISGHAGRSVVAGGYDLSPGAHAFVHAINDKIGAIGQTVTYVREPDGDRLPHVDAIVGLTADIRTGRVNTLVILGGNPAYDAPADLDFAGALKGVPTAIHLSLYENETSHCCRWHLPRAHYLESWGDGRAWDGTVSVAQPLIEPLFGGKSTIEVLGMLAGDSINNGEQIVRRTFESMLPKDQFEAAFRRVLHDGLLGGSAASAVEVALRDDWMVSGVPGTRPVGEKETGFTIRFVPSGTVYDGRFANSGWLQELPDGLTKLTWDNAACISTKDASALGVRTGDVIAVTAAGRTLEIAAYVLPGQPAGVIGLPLGYGRTHSGNVGTGVGFNTYLLRTSAAFHTTSAEVKPTGATYALAMTQDHHIIDRVGFEGRQERIGQKGASGRIIREASFAQYKADPHSLRRDEHGNVSLKLFDPPHRFNDPHAWGMSIDMTACVGCNACVVACQAENNIPVVGKDQVRMNREMHWIRIDRYFKGLADDPNPQVVHQPMMCQHCETAPCEQVCPVAATVHDTEGLNTMVYNRCIGTRYCSNNCPYKVRRFNYFDFHSKDPRGSAKPWLGIPDTQQLESIDKIKRMMFNPEVTVRMRGVMEKCTYCVQRIRAVQSEKRNRNEPVKDGDVVTACQQACPTQAIVFGNLNDKDAKVRELHASQRAYGVLDELDTRPRTQYLARLRNPRDNPAALNSDRKQANGHA